MFLAIFFFAIILGLLIYLDSKKPNNFPPGPKWLPIFGSALTVFRLRKRNKYLYLGTAELSNKYGPVVGLKVGIEKIVVAYGLHAIREMMLSNDMVGRPTGPFYELRTFGLRRGVLLTDEELWYEQRKFVVRHLREFGFGRRSMSAMIEDEAKTMILHFKKQMEKGQNSAVIEMDKMCGVHILNTLWMMLAGTRYSPEDFELNEVQRILTDLFKNIDMVGALFSQFPLLRFIAPDFSGYNLYMKSHRPLWKFVIDEVEKHKKTFVDGCARDLIDVYLQMLNSENRPDTYTEQQLLALCIDLFMAGSETTTKSFGFGFMYLLLNPDVQRKAQAEIDAVVGRHRLPTMQDRPNMPYLEGVVLESIRMFMGRGFGVPHRALKDTYLQGYFVPKDTMVVPNFHGILNGDEFGWNDPQAFRPDRYIIDGKMMNLPENYIPFGLGKRRCMGETLAKGNLFIFMAALLQHFDFAIPHGSEPTIVETDFLDGVTPGPKPYKALITLRS
ncbi:probable cytochrome P450 303a1 [Onthophagus taurus]|uniref:probable cytochrome P450 303a1 n=1 Tax=Onthophagus taurus TaxID=166361 RepID=UPI000C1FDB92|nr:probable cytochrome P450 303a1 [Onthophagus taurus]